MGSDQKTSWQRRQLLRLREAYSSIVGLWKNAYKKIKAAVGPKHDGKPSSHTVVWTLFTFMVFLIFASLAVKFPKHRVKVAFVSINSIVSFVLTIFVWRDLKGSKMTRKCPRELSLRLTTLDQGEYRRNLGNSILTVLFTIILLTAVYSLVWYPDLNALVLQLREDFVVCTTCPFWKQSDHHAKEQPRFPAVAVLQDTASDYQANIVNFQPPKCFSGNFSDGAPPCESLVGEQYIEHVVL